MNNGTWFKAYVDGFYFGGGGRLAFGHCSEYNIICVEFFIRTRNKKQVFDLLFPTGLGHRVSPVPALSNVIYC